MKEKFECFIIFLFGLFINLIAFPLYVSNAIYFKRLEKKLKKQEEKEQKRKEEERRIRREKDEEAFKKLLETNLIKDFRKDMDDVYDFLVNNFED